MEKSQTGTISIYLFLLFYIENFIFYSKTYLEKFSLSCYICITVFPHGSLLKMQ